MRLSLTGTLKTRVGDRAKDARTINGYPDIANGAPMLRKRPAALATAINIGANAQLLGTLLDTHVGIAFASSGQSSPNESSGVTATNNWTSSTKTSAANCVSVTPTMNLLSLRGVGNGTWYYRSVRWRVEYFNGNTWVALAWRTVTMGAQTSTPVSDSGTFNFPSAATWQWRIYAEALDAGGSFGSVTYSYSTETLNSATGNYSLNTVTSLVTVSHTWTLPASTLNTGWELYQVDYSMSFTLTKTGSNGIPSDYEYISGTTVSFNLAPSTVGATYSTTKTRTTAGSAYDTAALKIENAFAGGTSTAKNFDANVTAGSAKLYRRTVTSSNSTTAANTFTLSSYSWTLSVGEGGAVLVSDATKALLSIVGDDLSVVDVSGI